LIRTIGRIDRCVAGPGAGAALRCAAAAVAVVFPVIATACGARAQTLTEPLPQTKAPPPVTVTSPTTSRPKSCNAYGPGFVGVPGTDTCVKIGGFARFDATTNGR